MIIKDKRTIEIEVECSPESYEEQLQQFKQMLEDRFNCPVTDYESVDEKETDFYEEFKQHYGCSILEYMYGLGKGVNQ